MKTFFALATIISCLMINLSAPLSAQAKPVEETTPCLEEEGAGNTPRATPSKESEPQAETKAHACESCGS